MLLYIEFKEVFQVQVVQYVIFWLDSPSSTPPFLVLLAYTNFATDPNHAVCLES
jgi:hypothetical protein